ncbi:MAG: DNA recombination/repair protein RecA, partial [Dehalococcoidales bacterium]|nr:DNA recombination/repair protein RecA [Dehalococcoidales bacterium]
MTTEKEKALGLAINQIEKRYGKGSVMKLGGIIAAASVEAIPSGWLA